MGVAGRSGAWRLSIDRELVVTRKPVSKNKPTVAVGGIKKPPTPTSTVVTKASVQLFTAWASKAATHNGLEIPISVPVNGKSDIFTPLYLSNQNGSQQKLIGFGHGAPPQAQIR